LCAVFLQLRTINRLAREILPAEGGGQKHGDDTMETNEREAQVLRLAARGFRLFPCRRRSKIPQIKSWQDKPIPGVLRIRAIGLHHASIRLGTIVQYLFDAEKDMMIKFLKNDKIRTKILISSEIELPADLDRSEVRNAVFVSKAG
jgi:hypothetical protein